ARAQRAALALPDNIKSTRRCARAPSSALRAPSPVNGRRASFPTLAARFGISPSPAQREKGFSIRSLPRSLPLRPEAALLLRSGRRWRAAPDEGASAASCCCPFPGKDQKHASLRSRPLIRPPGTFSRKREKGFLPISRRKGRDQPFSCAAGKGLLHQVPAAPSGSSPSPAKREKVARSAG